MDKEFLESFKQEYSVEHKNNKLILDDELCVVSLGCEYSNNKKYESDSIERKIVEDFCYWLEEYFGLCEKSSNKINTK